MNKLITSRTTTDRSEVEGPREVVSGAQGKDGHGGLLGQVHAVQDAEYPPDRAVPAASQHPHLRHFPEHFQPVEGCEFVSLLNYQAQLLFAIFNAMMSLTSLFLSKFI